MPKQYTFKTTRATEWLEKELDSMPPSERSRFIRGAIIERLGQSDDTRITRSDEVTRHTSDVTQSQTLVGTDDFVAQKEEVDFNNVIKNMKNMFN